MREITKEVTYRRDGAAQVHKHELFPLLHLHRDEAVGFRIEILNSGEIRRAFQRSVEPIRPAVIRTPQQLRRSTWLSSNCGGVVPAHIEKCAKPAIVSSHRKDGFAGNLGSYELPWPA